MTTEGVMADIIAFVLHHPGIVLMMFILSLFAVSAFFNAVEKGG